MPSARSRRAVPEEDRLLSSQQVAELLGMGDWWVRNKFQLEVPPSKIGGKLRWEPWRVRAYIESKRLGNA